MDSILDPLLAILVIVLPIWLVYGWLELEERMRRKKTARHCSPDREAASGKIAQ